VHYLPLSSAFLSFWHLSWQLRYYFFEIVSRFFSLWWNLSLYCCLYYGLRMQFFIRLQFLSQLLIRDLICWYLTCSWKLITGLFAQVRNILGLDIILFFQNFARLFELPFSIAYGARDGHQYFEFRNWPDKISII